MEKYDLYLGYGVLVICGIYIFLITQLTPNAKIYPTFVAILLTILTLAFLAKTYISKAKSKLKESQEKVNIFADFQTKQFFFIVITSVVCIGFIKVLGFYITTLVYLVVSLLGLKIKRVQAILTGIGFCIVVYVVFTVLLKVPLPKGLIM